MPTASPPPSLLVWMVVAAVLFWLAPAPPEAPPPSAEEQAVAERQTQFVVRDAKRWQAEEGDLWVPWEAAEGHLAIVIDDVGRELHAFEKLHSLRFPLSFSVLPGAVYAAGVQLRLRQDPRRFREIWLHLPMEPLDPLQMQRGLEAREQFLLHTDDRKTLADKVVAALRRVPMAVGVNNHMGSRITTEAAAMDAVLAVVADRELVFLDSRTTADSVALERARAAEIPSAARTVFLDHDPDPRAIERALDRAVEAAKRGPIVAIGHPSMQLYEVLRKRLPEYHREGLGIYPASWVVREVSRRAKQVVGGHASLVEGADLNL